MTTIAALYVQANGCYVGLPGVEPWDEARDARRYPGPWPVVAHPPCARWCRLAGLVEARWGHVRGEDDGCFAAALAAVRRWGGVLEHPAYSDAWGAFGLNRPPASGGWVVADFEGGWTCHVEQGRYGHAAKKATWLYARGVNLPSLRWGAMADGEGRALVSWCANNTDPLDVRPRIGGKAASSTPVEFRDELIGMARGGKGLFVSPNPTDDPREIAARRKRAGPQSFLTAKHKSATPEPFRDLLLEMARGSRP